MSAKPYTEIVKDMENWVFGEQVVNKYKSKSLYISKSKTQNDRPRFQMANKNESPLRAPYGISKPFDENEADKERKSLDFSIDNQTLLEILNQVDTNNLKLAEVNSEKWFGKKLSLPQIEFMYRRLVTHDSNGTYKPTFRTKVNTSQSDRRTRFFEVTENNGEVKYCETNHSVVVNGSKFFPIVEFSGFWFSAKSFGMTLDCTDTIVMPGIQREDFPFDFGNVKIKPKDKSEPSDLVENNMDIICTTNQDGDCKFVPPSGPHNE